MRLSIRSPVTDDRRPVLPRDTAPVTTPRRPASPTSTRCTSSPARCSPSPTAAAPTTPTSRASRTPCGPSSTPSTSATTTSRPTSTSPRTACCSPSTTRSSTGSPTRTGRHRRPARTPRCSAALINGSEPVPTLAELFDAFPDARFNIDLKAAGAVRAARRVPRRARGLGPGLRRLVLRPPAAPVPPPHRRAGRHLGVARRGGGVPAAARAALARLAHPRPAAASLQVPHRRGPLTIVTAGLVRRAHRPGVQVHVWTIDDPEEMKDAARPWCRWPDDRPDRHTQGRADRARPMEDTSMTTGARPGAHRRPAARCGARRTRRPGTGTTGPTQRSTRPCSRSCSRRT